MNVYDSLIKRTLEIINLDKFTRLNVKSDVNWKTLDYNEYLMERDVAFELGDRFKPCTVYNCPTSNRELINDDRIYLLGKDLQKIKNNENFTRITFFNIDNEENQNKAYVGIKKLDYERYKIIPEGYMVLSSSVENKENIRVSRKAIKKGLDFETIGNLYINHYKEMKGVNNVWIIFLVGDYDFTLDLVNIAKEVDEVTNAFDHLLKNVILDCDVCPLKKICEEIEELRVLHFEKINKQKK